ncbi:hypothetical protein Enr10x_33700 [Gimesia panareensis]|uniref:Uncharacterized protein n=1 Tax=Gimesia panareensis TaxID=2527978 RepID=A0A517Q8V9_9PLAN|nr:hypothetical protein [Gimesia panareensis]QDT28031.1 hypothetical protein Enr10x_33700 [Gimesia panareensis]
MDNLQESRPAGHIWRTTALVAVGLLLVLSVFLLFAFSTHRIRFMSAAERNALIARELPPASTARLEHQLAADLSYAAEVVSQGKTLAVNVDLSPAAKSDITYRKLRRIFAQALSAVHESGYQDLAEVTLSASYPLADQAGVPTQTTVATITLDREALKKFSWKHILRCDVFEATKRYRFHPMVDRSPTGQAISQNQ